MMINELPQTYEGIAETFFENPDDRSQFRKVMLNNMKESTGIDPDVTNEAIAETLNEDRDEDLYQGIEKGLILNTSDPETRKNMLSNMETIGKLSRVYPNTAIEELFSDDYLSRKAATDDVFLINATNSNTDYPVYISRWNMFATRLLDRLNQDDPSLWSIAKRAVTPMLLGAVEGIGKKTAGKTFLAHGLTAAYDVSQLGNSIYNTQRDFNKRLRDIMGNKDLNAEQYVQEIESLLDDVQQVPEEYRYEIYNSLWRGPDLYADAGLSLTSFGFTGIVHGMTSLKANITRYLPSFSSQNVKHLVLNDELGQKIVDLATNSSNEEKAIEKVTAKVTENKPKDAPESEVAVAKGVAINEDSDKNLRQNSNKDGGFFNWLRSLEIRPSKDLSDQRGEIRFEEPEQSYYIDHGKGVNNDPMTYAEAVALQKKLQGRANPITPWKGGKYGLTQYFEYNPDIEPELIGVQSASKTSWTNDINKPGKWGYKEHQGEGAGDEWFFGGGYGSSIDSPWIAALKYYYKENEPTEVQKIDDIINRFHKDYISDEEFSKARKMFDKDNYIYQKFLDNERMWKEEDEAVESATKSLRNNMERKYSIVKFLKDIGAKDETINRVVDIENKFRGFNNDDIFQPNFIVDDIKQGLDEGPEHFNTTDNLDQLRHQIFKLSSDYKKLIKNMKEEFPDRDLDTLIELYKDHFKKHDDYLPHSVEFSEFVNSLAFFNHQVIAEEFYKHLKSIMTAEDFVPKTAHLQTLGDINPMKNPKGIFYYDDERGLIPFAELFDRANTEENYNKLLKTIQDDNAILDSIEKDAAEGMIKKYGYSNYSTSQKEEIVENFINDMKSNRDRLGNWRSKLENFILPFDENKQIATDRNYNAWEQDYLERKGVKRLWHNGGASQSFNLSIQNFEDLTPVILEETGIDTPWYRAIAHDNAHPIVSAGDGVGYRVRELHGVKDAKPMLIGKGYKVLDMGDYKEYNPKK